MNDARTANDEIVLTEADFERAEQSPYAGIARERGLRVLDADLRGAFPDSASVNRALRVLLAASREVMQKVELPKAS